MSEPKACPLNFPRMEVLTEMELIRHGARCIEEKCALWIKASEMKVADFIWQKDIPAISAHCGILDWGKK